VKKSHQITSLSSFPVYPDAGSWAAPESGYRIKRVERYDRTTRVSSANVSGAIYA